MGKGTIKKKKKNLILGNCRKGLRIRTLQSVKGKLQDGKEINISGLANIEITLK